MVAKPVVCLNDGEADTDKAIQIEECELVPKEVKPVKGQQETLVSLRLHATGVGL